MSDDGLQLDAQIIHAAYAERVKEAFKVFAENLSMGENENGSKERFRRALELTRKARDMAMDAMHGISVVEPAAALRPDRAARNPVGDALTADQQAMVDNALSGTTGQKAPAPIRR